MMWSVHNTAHLIYIDEIDKITKEIGERIHHRETYPGEGVQQALLKILERNGCTRFRHREDVTSEGGTDSD